MQQYSAESMRRLQKFPFVGCQFREQNSAPAVLRGRFYSCKRALIVCFTVEKGGKRHQARDEMLHVLEGQFRISSGLIGLMTPSSWKVSVAAGACKALQTQQGQGQAEPVRAHKGPAVLRTDNAS